MFPVVLRRPRRRRRGLGNPLARIRVIVLAAPSHVHLRRGGGSGGRRPPWPRRRRPRPRVPGPLLAHAGPQDVAWRPGLRPQRAAAHAPGRAGRRPARGAAPAGLRLRRRQRLRLPRVARAGDAAALVRQLLRQRGRRPRRPARLPRAHHGPLPQPLLHRQPEPDPLAPASQQRSAQRAPVRGRRGDQHQFCGIERYRNRDRSAVEWRLVGVECRADGGPPGRGCALLAAPR